jgi:hypothetical protein
MRGLGVAAMPKVCTREEELMKRLKLVLLAVGIAGASLALTACGGGGGPGEKSFDLTIGDRCGRCRPQREDRPRGQ